jgi:septal ring factor EnvC (AmiA/AmiB activator)
MLPLLLRSLLQAQAAELSRTVASKEAECRQLQDCSREQQQKLAEAAAAAEQQAAELTALQVRLQVPTLVSSLACLKDGHDNAACQSTGRTTCRAGCLSVSAAVCCRIAQADVASAQQQLSDMQTQCGALTSERTALQQQLAEAGSGAGKLREQLQHAQAEAAQLQKDADSSAREASSLRSQLSQQVSAMQELQQAASGSGKELQVGCWLCGHLHWLPHTAQQPACKLLPPLLSPPQILHAFKGLTAGCHCRCSWGTCTL